MDRRAWWATVHGVAKSRTQLSEHKGALHIEHFAKRHKDERSTACPITVVQWERWMHIPARVTCAQMEMSSGACRGAESRARPRFEVFRRLPSKKKGLFN